MIYKDIKGLQLSTLGFGAMRLPSTRRKGPIIEDEAMKLIKYAYEHGVNYFDTSLIYHSGQSELFLGKALSQFPRDTWYLADKMPGNYLEAVDGGIKLKIDYLGMGATLFETPTQLFELQLERCGVDYFDFYLLHNVADFTFDIYTDERVGMIDCLLEQKKAGRIRHFGFSTHARPALLEKYLNMYDCFDFAMIQLNYLDRTLQEATKKYDMITERGLPVFVMGPTRGGILANPGKEAAAIFEAAQLDAKPASLAFRYVQSFPNVSVILSGMSTIEQIEENLGTFSEFDPLTAQEWPVLQRVADALIDFVPCTECRYCCGACPKNLDIPGLMSAYNEAAVEVSWVVDGFLAPLDDDEKPQACTGCAACTPYCPQNIDIPGAMRKFVRALERAEAKCL